MLEKNLNLLREQRVLPNIVISATNRPCTPGGSVSTCTVDGTSRTIVPPIGFPTGGSEHLPSSPCQWTYAIGPAPVWKPETFLRAEAGTDPKTEIPFSGIPVRPSFLPGHSNSGSMSQYQSTDSLIPAKPRRMCSYVADSAQSLCVHRKTGSSGTATHPRSPTLHLSTLGFWCFNQQFVDTSFPPGGGRSPMVEVSTQCSEGSPSYPDQKNQTPSCSQMHRTSAGEHIGMHWRCPVYGQQQYSS